MTDIIEKPAIPFAQTDRKGWVITMRPSELIRLLPPRPPEQLGLFTDTNRPITSRHLDGLEEFIEKTEDWALPNITLAATPGNIREKNGLINLDPEHLKVLDGQHRLQALGNLIHQYTIQDNQESKHRLDYLDNQLLPITIFEVRNNGDQRQLFAWFARSKPIEATVRDYYDNTDPYNQAAKAVIEDSKVLKDRTSWQVKTIPANSPNVLSLANMKEIATTIHIGVGRGPKALDRRTVKEQGVQMHLQGQLLKFFDEFLPSCKTHYGFLKTSDRPKTDTMNSKQASYALNHMMIRLFANAWARWNEDLNPEPIEKLADYISTLNLNQASPENDVVKKFALLNEKRKLHGLRHKAWEAATAKILKEARAA